MLRLSIFICVEIEGLQHVNAMSLPLGWDVWVNEWKWCAFEACMRARENAKKIIDLRQHTEYMYPSGRLYSTHSSVRAGEKTYEWKKLLYIYLLLFAICQWNVIAAYIAKRRNNIKYNKKNRNSNRNVNLKILWQLLNEWFFLRFSNNLTCFPSKLIQLLWECWVLIGNLTYSLMFGCRCYFDRIAKHRVSASASFVDADKSRC